MFVSVVQSVNNAVDTATTDDDTAFGMDVPLQNVSASNLEEDDTVDNVVQAGKLYCFSIMRCRH